MKTVKLVFGIFLFLLSSNSLYSQQPADENKVCLRFFRTENPYVDSIAAYLSSEWLNVRKENKEDMLMALWINKRSDTLYHVVGVALGYGRDDCTELYNKLKGYRYKSPGYFVYDSILVLVYPLNDLEGLFTIEAATLAFDVTELLSSRPVEGSHFSKWEPFNYYFTLKPDGFSLNAVVGYINDEYHRQ